MKRFYEQGKLEEKWIDRYCKGDYKIRVRYEMVGRGKPHPDNMLPNGKIREDLK